MADKSDLALAAAKLALKSATGGDEEAEEGPSWGKRALAVSVGGFAGFYLFNKYLFTIIVGLDKIDIILSLALMYWSLTVWGIRPLKALKQRRERKKLEAATGGAETSAAVRTSDMKI